MMTFSRTWIEVDLQAIAANATAIKAHTGTCLITVIKADAYGHGAVRVALALHEIADMFAVATVEEGIELRKAGIHKPILILLSPLPELAEALVAHQLTPAIDNWQLAQRLVGAISRTRLPVHVDINTGMNRGGVHWTEAKAFLEKLKTLKQLEIGGIFTHFATADEVDKSYAYLQLERFSAVLDKRALPVTTTVHAANSAATLTIPEARFDAVRPGLSLYGIYPSAEKPIPLQPALTWKTRIGWVGWLEAGEGVSYGLTYRAPRRTRVAALQVGYGDGYPRALSNPPTVGRGPVIRHAPKPTTTVEPGPIPRQTPKPTTTVGRGPVPHQTPKPTTTVETGTATRHAPKPMSTVERGPVPHQTPKPTTTVGRGPVPRHAPIGGEVLIAGKRRPIAGRICMDVTVVQLEPSDNVSVGDEAVLIGKQGDAELGIDEIATRAGTISYHILTQISNRVERNYKPSHKS